MRVIIAGGRDIEDYEFLKRTIRDSGFIISTVISGTARGVDRMGERYAAEHGLQCERYPADWTVYGKAAGPIRNIAMSKVAEALIAIYKDGSKGTKHMISVAEKKGLKVYKVKYE